MRRLTLLLMLVGSLMSVRGQTGYTYRYWFDNDASTLKTGSATEETSIEIDASSLNLHQSHALRMQVCNSSGVWSAVRTLYFLRAAASLSSSTGRYWFDNDISTAKVASTVNGTFDIDVSDLSTGVHAVHYQTTATDGTASVARTQHFLLTDYDAERLRCEFLIDDDEEHSVSYSLGGDNIELDISGLKNGTHQLTSLLYDGAGVLVERKTTEFEIGTSGILPGDVNGDGVVNVSDIVELVNFLRGNLSDAFHYFAADANNDESVNDTDVDAIADIIMSAAGK